MQHVYSSIIYVFCALALVHSFGICLDFMQSIQIFGKVKYVPFHTVGIVSHSSCFPGPFLRLPQGMWDVSTYSKSRYYVRIFTEFYIGQFRADHNLYCLNVKLLTTNYNWHLDLEHEPDYLQDKMTLIEETSKESRQQIGRKYKII